ncbi:hypothetical protein [Brumimicrobium oceani]|uniref:Outer membrane protein beta-barrel domain-containing protein n=1 Tax=Brumimicrobium oceani TaxID=2100725 RepID=A0A2U2XH76_9FLAO|nr:hypothetical protein [Brumimicrobium oceani]PWH87144.1 hypothetical protein DIT68_02460 [Brumimicrobium oceani]
MKRINCLLLLSLISSSLISFGQESPETPVKRIKISDFILYSGLSFERTNLGSFNDFRELAPESELLQNDMSLINQNQGYSYLSNGSFSVLLGIQFSDKNKTRYKVNPLLRLGLTYSSGSRLSTYNYGEERTPFDTLTSSETGNETYIDSVYAERYSMNYNSEQILLNASLIFRTDHEARWSLFSGIGFTAGVSINSSTGIHYFSEDWKEEQSTNEFSVNNQPRDINIIDDEYENFENKTNYGFSAYIPIGVDFRIGNKKEFWKKAHLFYEVQPTLNVYTIPELGTFNSVNFRHGIGVRINFN